MNADWAPTRDYRARLNAMNASRMRDYVIYVSIGIVLVALIMWSAVRYPGPPKIEAKWVFLAVETPIIFGYAIADFRRCFGRPFFGPWY